MKKIYGLASKDDQITPFLLENGDITMKGALTMRLTLKAEVDYILIVDEENKKVSTKE